MRPIQGHEIPLVIALAFTLPVVWLMSFLVPELYPFRVLGYLVLLGAAVYGCYLLVVHSTRIKERMREAASCSFEDR